MNDEQKNNYQQALELMTQHKWLDAAVILEDLINELPDDEVIKNLVLSLYQAKQYARAFVYFSEQPGIFATDRADAQLAVHLLLQNQSYMSARQFIVGLPVQWQDDLLERVKTAEKFAHEKYQTTIQTLLRSFYHLGDCPLGEQQERLRDAQQLPLADYLTGAQFLLRDPFTHQLIKAAIIDTLRQIVVDKDLTIQWLDGEEYQVNPSQLLAIDDLEIVKELREELAARVEHQDPTQFQLASQELQMQLMLLYPLITAKITAPGDWITCLLARIRGQKVTGLPAIGALQDRLTKIIDDLTEKH